MKLIFFFNKKCEMFSLSSEGSFFRTQESPKEASSGAGLLFSVYPVVLGVL